MRSYICRKGLLIAGCMKFRTVLDAPCNLLSRLTHFVFASHGTHFNFCHQNECYGSQILQKRPFRNLLVGMPKHCLGNPQIFICHRSQKSLINPLNRFTFPAGVEYYAHNQQIANLHLEPLHALLGRARAQIPKTVRFVTVRSEQVRSQRAEAQAFEFHP